MKHIRAYQDLTNQPNKKIDYYLKDIKGKNALFIFDHGLGDYVEFLSLFNTVQKLHPKWKLKVGFHHSLGLEGLHNDGIALTEESDNFVLPIGSSIVQNPNVLQRYDIDKLLKKYDAIFAIQYYDYLHPNIKTGISNPKCKNEMCKVLEFGIHESVDINRYQIKLPNKAKTNKVAFHFNGNTDKDSKTPSIEVQEQIWNEIKSAGYEPIDVHQNHYVSIPNSKKPLPSFIPESQSIRNMNGGIPLLLDVLAECKFFVGILSGPLHLANNVLGCDKCVGIKTSFDISKYVGNGFLDVIDGKYYVPGKVEKFLKDRSK